MRAVDTNILVCRHRRQPASSARPRGAQGAGRGAEPWAIPWPCAYEFLRIVTHPRIYHPSAPMARALGDLDRILGSPLLVLPSETPRHAGVMRQVLGQSGATGNLIHDAHIAALCLEHGVSDIVTGGRDFSRFARLPVVNPLA